MPPDKLMPTPRRRLLRATGAAALASVIAPGAWAQAWPGRPVRLVAPFPPGGLMDTVARLLSPPLAQALGQPFVVENKPGAGGNLGAAEVARAAPDGHTLLMASPALVISPAVYASLPYKPEQIAPIGLVGRVPNVLLVNPHSGIQTVADLLAHLRQAGRKANYASNGNGTSLHLSAELFKHITGLDVTHVPYKGAAAAATALMAGDVDMMFENLPSVIGQIQGGKVRALAVTTRQRSHALPDVPTLEESGLKGFDVSAWFGLAGPAGLPADVTARAEAALRQVASDAQVVRGMTSRGAQMGFAGAADMARAMAEETARWKQVAASARISVG